MSSWTASLYKSILFFQCEITNSQTSTSSFKIKFKNQNVALQLIMGCLQSSNEFWLACSLATLETSLCKIDNITVVTWCECLVRVIWIALKNKTVGPGLVVKESGRAAVHPDEANKFFKQIQSTFSVCKPPSRIIFTKIFWPLQLNIFTLCKNGTATFDYGYLTRV